MLLRYFKVHGIKIINVVRREDQAEILKREGAEYVLVSTDPEFSKKLSQLTNELKATIYLDAVAGQLAGQILEAMPNGSVLYNYGSLSEEPIANVGPLELIYKNKSIRGY